MLSRSLLLARQIGKSASAVQSVRHGGGLTPREIAVKYNNDVDALPVPQGSWKESYKARDTKFNIHIALLLALNVVSYYYILKVCPGPDKQARPASYKIDPPIYNTYEE